jgi:hypothetical protein
MSTSPILTRLVWYFLSAFPQDFVLTFGIVGIGGAGGSGVAVVCAVIVLWWWCLKVQYLDKTDNSAHHVTFAG